MTDVGKQMYEIIRAVRGAENPPSNYEHCIARSAGRFIEEVTELALAFGLSSGQIVMHVVDALHNEAKKVKHYPSQLVGNTSYIQGQMLEELANCKIQIDYLTFLTCRQHILDVEVSKKLTLLTNAAARGEMVYIDGVIYRKESQGQ